MKRLETGIPGLDELAEGGLPVGGVFLLQGAPGTGKTILANQLCFHHARHGGQAVYLTLLAETHVRMFEHLRRHRFFDEALIGHSVHYHAAYEALKAGLDKVSTIIRTAVTQRDASLVVIDGLVNAEEIAPSTPKFKELLHAIQTIAGNLWCTVLLLSSATSTDGIPAEHTMVDGIVELTLEVRGLRARRELQIRKMRGVRAALGRHSLDINDQGIMVMPRFEARLSTVGSGTKTVPGPGRKGFGIDELDRMLGGGLPAGSTTMIVGPTGAGKTILGLQFVCSGARDGERGLYLGFYEQPEAIIAKSKRIGLAVHEVVEAGTVSLHWERPIEGILDVVADRLLRRIEETGASRVCIDGLNSLRRMIDAPDRFQAATATLSEELARRDVTAVYTFEAPDPFGPSLSLPLDDVSATAQNILLLRHVELRAQLYRLISILKMRDSAYDSRIREFRITDDEGIVVADTFQSAEAVLSGSATTRDPQPVRRRRRTTRKTRRK
jgi:circadian clock protein KaiC